MQKKLYKNIAILVAAGSGSRFGDSLPKQYYMYKNKVILRHVIDRLNDSGLFDAILVAIHPDHQKYYNEAIKDAPNLLPPVFGGKERQDSVYCALESIKNLDINPDYIYIHDAARIWISDDILYRLQDRLKDCLGVIPTLDITDTIKEVTKDGIIVSTIPREFYKRAQTPQAFHWPEIYTAHKNQKGKQFTDDAAIFEAEGYDIATIMGSKDNKKITYIDDIPKDEREYEMIYETRIGIGFDVHAFATGDHLWLGGIKLAFEKTLKGHSDADVALHAITDALFGAMADGDIGSHFPPSDNQWKGAASDQFLIYACERLNKLGGKIINVDLTIIGERPKITPIRDEMRKKIAEIMNISVSRVSVKATTTEKLGFTGRSEGLAAQAAVSIQLPIVND